MKLYPLTLLLLLLFPITHDSFSQEGIQKKKIIFITKDGEHDPGEHEFVAGCNLLASLLNRYSPNIDAQVYTPEKAIQEKVIAGADAIVIYSRGGNNNPALLLTTELTGIAERKKGIVLLHAAVEVPREKMGKEFLQWIGGYFETHYSVNPRWEASFSQIGQHEISHGVDSFGFYDEWYYHLRFDSLKNGITPILTAVPPASSLTKPDGPYSGNAQVRNAVAQKEPQTLAWAFVRSNGGRSFACTGGHYYKNWQNEAFRKLILNAIVWAAGLPVTENGTETPTPGE